MKATYLFIASIFFIANANHSPTTYVRSWYFSSISGNDTTGDGSINHPYRSVTRLNTIFPVSISAGDSIFFKRDETFFTSTGIKVARSGGGANQPTYIGPYGIGKKPVISGFVDITFGTPNGNVYKSNELLSVPALNVVTVNGVVTGMGRYPQSGYFNIDSHTSSSITSSDLSSPSQPTWRTSTAEAVIRTTSWTIDRYQITGQTSNTLSFTNTHASPQDNWGFFIQNDSSTLKYNTAWYLSPSNNLKYYSTSGTPAGVRASNAMSLLVSNSLSNVTIDNLSFQGANDTCINITGGSRVNVENCDIFGGMTAIMSTASYSHYNNNNISNMLDNGIWVKAGGNTDTASNNLVYNTSVIRGTSGYVGGSRDDNGTGIGTREDNTDIENNTVRNTGCSGIWFYKVDNIHVINNWVDTFDINRTDLGGIYSVSNDGTTPSKGRQVLNNIVSVGMGDRTGSTNKSGKSCGIYMDVGTYGVTISGNSVSNCDVGIFTHKAANISILNNILYVNDTAIQINHESSSSGRYATGFVVTGNVEFAANTQKTLMVSDQMSSADVNAIGTIDYNTYLRPYGTNNSILDYNNGPGSSTLRTLSSWQGARAYDDHSTVGTITYNSSAGQSDSTSFYFNTTSSPTTKVQSGTYYDAVSKNTYVDNIPIPAHGSVVLFKLLDGSIIVVPNSNIIHYRRKLIPSNSPSH